jgi:hypothetical protein
MRNDEDAETNSSEMEIPGTKPKAAAHRGEEGSAGARRGNETEGKFDRRRGIGKKEPVKRRGARFTGPANQSSSSWATLREEAF